MKRTVKLQFGLIQAKFIQKKKYNPHFECRCVLSLERQCVSVCERERERERKKESVCVCV